MARPKKKGLVYFPKDVDYYDDTKIMDLLYEYGPLGQTIYDIIITYVYKNGYYLDIPLDKLATLIIRIVGNRWIKEKNLVLQVIDYCADIGLFDKDLLSQNIITSTGIQHRYSEVTVRNKVDTSKYWLLNDESEAACITAAKNTVSVAETRVFVTETPVSDTKMQQSKVNESKVNESKVCTPAQDVHTYGQHGLIKLTLDQYTELTAEYGKNVIDGYIERIDTYLRSSGKKPFDNHYATILKWLQGDGIKKKSDHSYDLDKLVHHAETTTPKLK